MWCRLALVTLLAASTEAFAPAPIRWGGLPARNVYLALERSASLNMAAGSPHKLTLVDQPIGTALAPGTPFNFLPSFTATLDNTITLKNPELCIEADGTRSGATIRLDRCTGGPAQRWKWVPLGYGKKNQIQLQGTNQCLDVVAREGGIAGAAPSTPAIELRECENRASEAWNFEEAIPLPSTPQHSATFTSMHILMSTSVLALSLGALFLWRQKNSGLGINAGVQLLSMDRGGVFLTLPIDLRPSEADHSLTRISPVVMSLSPISCESADSREKDLVADDHPVITNLDNHSSELQVLAAPEVEDTPAAVRQAKHEHAVEKAIWELALAETVEEQNPATEVLVTEKVGMGNSDPIPYFERLRPQLEWLIFRENEASSPVLAVLVLAPSSVDKDGSEKAAPKEQSTLSQISSTMLNISSSIAEALRGTGASQDVAGMQADRISIAIKRMQADMSMLDTASGGTPQLSAIELSVLLGAVGTATFSPYVFGMKTVEVLVPSMGALLAALGFSAEYTGKTAVARGKEIAAVTLQAAAEAEMYLAQAERSKAIIPLCVGVSATTSAFAVAAPLLVAELGIMIGPAVYLLCPGVAGLAAAVAALASAESSGLANVAMDVGDRRFSAREGITRTWLSATQQIQLAGLRMRSKWINFGIGVLPAPLLGAIVPGCGAFKAIVAAGVAAAQAAYSLAKAEYRMSQAVEAVALKSRAAALADTYANQGSRAASILPFTSALSGLCAAITVTAVEFLPVMPGPVGASVLCTIFPSLGAIFAAAASVSKACAEVDAEAAAAAATSFAEAGYNKTQREPVAVTIGLIRTTLQSSRRQMSQVFRRNKTSKGVKKTQGKRKNGTLKQMTKLDRLKFVGEAERAIQKVFGYLLALATFKKFRPALQQRTDTVEKLTHADKLKGAQLGDVALIKGPRLSEESDSE